MRLSTLHTHSNFCDGKNTIEEFCQTAWERKFISIGFSSHAPLPTAFAPPTDWHCSWENLETYAEEVRAAKKRWAGRLDVLLGLEIDYIPHWCGPGDKSFNHMDLDYRIGSVHYLIPPQGAPFTVDGPPEEWEQGIKEGFGGDADSAVTAYWTALTELVQEGGADILGHMDLIKKNNRDAHWFNPEGSAYIKGIEKALLAISRSNMVVEVNTGGLNRGSIMETYPAPAILHRLRALDVPVTINSDAHIREDVDGHYENARLALLEAGYTNQVLFIKKEPIPRTARGIETGCWICEPL